MVKNLPNSFVISTSIEKYTYPIRLYPKSNVRSIVHYNSHTNHDQDTNPAQIYLDLFTTRGLRTYELIEMSSISMCQEQLSVSAERQVSQDTKGAFVLDVWIHLIQF